ncbi:MAG TPA: phBC6A51 family helix-turn-helix protein [Candidatus Woesebacteria bacterium]|nr:phBC6A51 family helix-turn-helix protein [Candidatus Woesebacteria bacterium]
MRTIEERQIKAKQDLLEQLKKTPIVQVACQKINIGRATYYRWRHEDEEFSQKADEAIMEGALLVNDIAESQLMTAIKNQNLTAIIFWLKHHHPNYATKFEVTARLKADNESLTPEQEALVTKALKLAALLPENIQEEEKV